MLTDRGATVNGRGVWRHGVPGVLPSPVFLALLCHILNCHLHHLTRHFHSAVVVDAQSPPGRHRATDRRLSTDPDHPQSLGGLIRPAGVDTGSRRRRTATGRFWRRAARRCCLLDQVDQEADGSGSSSQEHDAAQGEHE